MRFHPSKDLVLTASGDTTCHLWQAAITPEQMVQPHYKINRLISKFVICISTFIRADRKVCLLKMKQSICRRKKIMVWTKIDLIHRVCHREHQLYVPLLPNLQGTVTQLLPPIGFLAAIKLFLLLGIAQPVFGMFQLAKCYTHSSVMQ